MGLFYYRPNAAIIVLRDIIDTKLNWTMGDEHVKYCLSLRSIRFWTVGKQRTIGLRRVIASNSCGTKIFFKANESAFSNANVRQTFFLRSAWEKQCSDAKRVSCVSFHIRNYHVGEGGKNLNFLYQFAILSRYNSKYFSRNIYIYFGLIGIDEGIDI